MDYYPAWLGTDTIENDLPWDHSVKISVPAFLSKYTLHDSGWVGLYLKPGLEAVALISWDTFWYRDKIYFPGSQVGEWPFLLIQFERIYQVNMTYEKPDFPKLTTSISGAESSLITMDQRELFLEEALSRCQQSDKSREYLLDETLHHTIFWPHYGGQVELWHGGETRFLCLNREKEVITIPDLE